MKSSQKSVIVSRSISKKSGTDSVSVVKAVESNLRKSAEILTAKKYPAEYCPRDTHISKTPYIRFGEKITEFSFTDIPSEVHTDTIDGEFILAVSDPKDTSPEDELFKNSSLLLKWAQRLKEACALYGEIDVPCGEDPKDFFYSYVSDELMIADFDCDGPFPDVDEDEAEYTITFFQIVSPKGIKPFNKLVEEFSRSFNVAASASKWNWF